MKYFLSILGLALIIILTTLFFSIKNADMIVATSQQQPTTTMPGPMMPNQTNNPTISTTDLQKHNTPSDCWVGYQDKIYDITAYLPKHPGRAAAITPYCGTAKEFENAFVKQHGTSKVAMLMRMGVHMGEFTPVGALQ
ncbi:MAG: cytochrome b5-like heme/steroid binding domain-containing protein [Nanoarchaeota archaeon]